MVNSPATPGFDPLVELVPGSGDPLWCVHPAAGISWEYLALGPWLPAGQRITALQAEGLSKPDQLPGSVEELAERFLALVREVQPSGPYRLLGWSFGGMVAHAMGRLLREAGEVVALLALLDCYPHDAAHPEREPSDHEYLTTLLENAGCDPAGLVQPDGAPLDERRARAVLLAGGHRLAGLEDWRLEAVLRVFLHHIQLRRDHTPARFDGDVLFVRAALERTAPFNSAADWAPYVDGVIDVHQLPTEHRLLLRKEPAERIGRLLAQRLAPRGEAGA
ncbi:thioesterase domain-containing protein [Kitasatospora sp. NBC_01287]|uniref:thioesterase domain-containing protein n=1 Tax=Kitasatospora sp. NBC_01287 TaxID=2903573 RepID=UPI0022533663|nr:thioesterase domain-containing protein [Kitasatospora sp. NBC_01287]MCX4744829.1 thioesterase domain-containing protein [Kitasatospora sp. NBC_01287]